MPEDPVARAVALHEQAIAARLEGRYHDGERACREATLIFESIDGPQSPDLANALIEQGRLLDRLDRLAEAEAVLDRAVAILTPPALPALARPPPACGSSLPPCSFCSPPGAPSPARARFPGAGFFSPPRLC